MNKNEYEELLNNSHKQPYIRLPMVCAGFKNGQLIGIEVDYNVHNANITILSRLVSTLNADFLDGLYSMLDLNGYKLTFIKGCSLDHFALHEEAASKYSMLAVMGRVVK